MQTRQIGESCQWKSGLSQGLTEALPPTFRYLPLAVDSPGRGDHGQRSQLLTGVFLSLRLVPAPMLLAIVAFRPLQAVRMPAAVRAGRVFPITTQTDPGIVATRMHVLAPATRTPAPALRYRAGLVFNSHAQSPSG